MYSNYLKEANKSFEEYKRLKEDEKTMDDELIHRAIELYFQAYEEKLQSVNNDLRNPEMTDYTFRTALCIYEYLFDNLQLTAENAVEGDEDESEDEKDQKTDKDKYQSVSDKTTTEIQKPSKTTEEILSQKMEQNSIEDKPKAPQDKKTSQENKTSQDNYIQEKTSEENKTSEDKKEVPSQTNSTKINSVDQVTPAASALEKSNSKNSQEKQDKMGEEESKEAEKEEIPSGVYTKEELQLSCYEMLEVTRVNLEGQLASSPDDVSILLKLIDTRKYIAFYYQLANNVECALQEFEAAVAIAESIKDIGENWRVYAELIFDQANASYELGHQIDKIALPNYMELRDMYIKKINGGKDITEDYWSYCQGNQGDSAVISDYKIILGEILNKVEEATDEINNKDLYSEIVEKTRAMRDEKEASKFDEVKTDLGAHVVDISNTIKRKRESSQQDNTKQDSTEPNGQTDPENRVDNTVNNQANKSEGDQTKSYKRLD